MRRYGMAGIAVVRMTARTTPDIWTGLCVLFRTGPISSSAETPNEVSETTLPCTLGQPSPM